MERLVSRQGPCGCRECNPGAWWFIVCETCGNKRCPHATDHRHACSGSNEPGQPGSVFGDPIIIDRDPGDETSRSPGYEHFLRHYGGDTEVEYTPEELAASVVALELEHGVKFDWDIGQFAVVPRQLTINEEAHGHQ